MEEIISLENIRVGADAANWEDSLRQAGKPLVDNGSIDAKYIDEMIEAVKRLGPYIVLMPGFALGHSEPSPSVKRNDISLITLRSPVEFGSANDPVRVVMCLACIDKNSHIEKLKSIAFKLMSKDIIEKMAECKDEKELYNLINEDNLTYR